MREVRVGQLGLGHWGPNLLRNLLGSAGCSVVGVAEPDPARRAFAAARFPGVRVVADAERLLHDPAVDALVIATPPRTHAALLRRALEANKDVLVEKPLATSLAELRGLDARDRVVMVGHTFLYSEAVAELKRRLDDRAVGRVHYVHAQRLNLGIARTDVNAAWSLAPHDLSILMHLFGERPCAVAATGVRALDGPEDVVFLRLRFPTAPPAHVHVSWLDASKVRRMTFVGERGMLVYDDVADDKLRIYARGVSAGDRAPLRQPIDFAEFRAATRAGDVVIPRVEEPEPLAVEVAHFLACVRARTAPRTGLAEGRRVIACLEAADRSLGAAGREVEVSDE